MRACSCCVVADFPPAPSRRPRWPTGERAAGGQVAPGRRTRALALPQGAGRAAVPSWCEGGDVFPPPHFRVLLPPRTHSSSRHNLRIPDLGGAPRRARSACTRGPRRRPVARSVRGAWRLLSHSSFPAFAQVGRLPPRHHKLPRTSHPSRLPVPAARGPAGGGAQGAAPR